LKWLEMEKEEELQARGEGRGKGLLKKCLSNMGNGLGNINANGEEDFGGGEVLYSGKGDRGKILKVPWVHRLSRRTASQQSRNEFGGKEEKEGGHVE